VLWSAQHFPRLLELSGDQGARVLFRDLADQILEVDMPDDAVLVDIDTQAALDSVLTRFAQAEATQDVH
jgi:CTP:molybdopterin cytidylyltransferase MocA